MSALHKEAHFAAEICAHLAAHGWLYAEEDAALFDTGCGPFLPDFSHWPKASRATHRFPRLMQLS